VGPLWQGNLYSQEVVLLRSGIGPERATQAATWLVQHYTLQTVLSVGFAGGLQASLATGDAILPLRILPTGAGAETIPPYAPAGIIPNAGLAHHAAVAATQAGLTPHQGTLLSVTEIVSHAVAKQRLGEQFGAVAVDMESYSIGRVAAAYHLPFMVLRTIFDTQADDVPFQANRFTSADGALQPMRVLSYVAHHPRVLAQVPYAWGKMRTASQGLESWLGHFLRQLHQTAA
jgi:adenosylhomocysteine nucleosidase